MDGLPEAAVCDVWQIVETQTQDPREAGGNRSDLMKKTNTKAETQKLNNVQTKKRNRQIKRWRSNLEKHEEQKPENKPWETRRHGSTQTANTRLINRQDTGEHRWTKEELKSKTISSQETEQTPPLTHEAFRLLIHMKTVFTASCQRADVWSRQHKSSVGSDY